MPLHVVVADYPETLAVLLRSGLDLRAVGGRRSGEVLDEEMIVGRLASEWAWRERNRSAIRPRATSGPRTRAYRP